MSRWLKAVPLILALAGLSIFATGCGSNAPANIRFVNAIQDSKPVDIDVTGPDTNKTQEFANVAFLGVLPTQPGYMSVPSGSDTLQGYLTGTTSQVFSSSVNWGSATSYTVIGTGFSQTGNNGSNIVLLSIPDDIPTPPDGDVEFRVINASPGGPPCTLLMPPCPNTVDVYIEQNPSNGPGLPITIKGLAYTQASQYVPFAFNPNDVTTPPGFTVYVTPSGSMTPIIAEGLFPDTVGAARTLVLTDVRDGSTMNSTFLELSDLN